MDWTLPKKTDTLARNQEILASRWPDLWEIVRTAPQPRGAVLTATPQLTLLVDGIHLSSGYDRRSEAALQAGRVPETCAQVWVYGPGLGDLPRLLLKRQALKTLHVILLNLGLFALCLNDFDQSDWLADERVILTAANPHCTLQYPFAVAPAWLKLVDDRAARIRDAILVELDRPFLAQHYRQAEYLPERLQLNRAWVGQDGDVAALFGSQTGSTVLVAAAGPTLSDHYDWLRTARPGTTLIAVDAALKPLAEAGIIPDLAVVIDEKQKMADFFAFDLQPYRQVPLVYFPGVFTPILEAWPGPRLAAYPEGSRRYNQLEDNLPRGRLFSSGSVLHPAVDLAVKMGAGKVVLLGADFGYPRSLSHVAGSAPAAVTPREHGPASWVLNGHGERIPSRADLQGHLSEFEAYVRRQVGVKFVNASQAGARIEGVDYEGLGC